MDKIKLSFKKGAKNTGLYAVGNPYSETQIKINGKRCGMIRPPSWNSENNGWKIMFAVVKKDIMEDNNPNCIWKWISLKGEFEKEEIARIHVLKNIEKVLEGREMYYFDKND